MVSKKKCSPLPGEMIQFDWYVSNGLKPPTRRLSVLFFGGPGGILGKFTHLSSWKWVKLMSPGAPGKRWFVNVSLVFGAGGLAGSTIRTLLHGKIKPKDWQVLSLGDVGVLLFFRVVRIAYRLSQSIYVVNRQFCDCWWLLGIISMLEMLKKLPLLHCEGVYQTCFGRVICRTSESGTPAWWTPRTSSWCPKKRRHDLGKFDFFIISSNQEILGWNVWHVYLYLWLIFMVNVGKYAIFPWILW